ncbi:MAG: hypothetical protein ACOCZL_04190 [Bacteroidota bacterium]
MPYRRLPNTDNSRLKSLRKALDKGKEIPPFKLAFSQSTLTKVQSLLPSYENALSEHKTAYNLQVEKNKDYHKKMKKAKTYISHFIQVINMSIQRGETATDLRTIFGLPEGDKKLPSLSTEKDIMYWSDRLMEGEQKRQMKGLSPITNPTIAVVKVHCDKFKDSSRYQANLTKRLSRAQEDLAEKRKEADTIIQQLWNEVEETFKDLPEELRRNKASEYGVVYVFRKNELNKFEVLNNLHLNIN